MLAELTLHNPIFLNEKAVPDILIIIHLKQKKRKAVSKEKM